PWAVQFHKTDPSEFISSLTCIKNLKQNARMGTKENYYSKAIQLHLSLRLPIQYTRRITMPNQLKPLPKSFYNQPTLQLAQSLLGKLLLKETDDGVTGGFIV